MEIINRKLKSGKIVSYSKSDKELLLNKDIRVDKLGYAYIRFWDKKDKKARVIKLHRFIMKAEKGLVVDHIDGNPLNNCRENLRICTRTENLWNSKKSKNNKNKYKGIYWSKTSNKWFAQIQRKNKRYFLGYFEDEESACLVYNQKAKELSGEFAYLNRIV